jgi:glycosyltransferase involved in cell wall biosynthesis
MRNRGRLDLSDALYPYSVEYGGFWEQRPMIKEFWKVYQRLCQIEPDEVVIEGYDFQGAWAAWFWAKLRRKPIIMWFESNEHDYKRHAWKELVKQVFVRGCSAGHTYGSSSKRYLVKLGLSADRISTGLAVVDVDLFARGCVSRLPVGADRVVLFVGRFVPAKNLLFLISAFSTYVRQQSLSRLRLFLIGEGPMENVLRESVKKFGLEERVTFRGFASQSELAGFYRASHFLVLPSTREVWGLVVNEAMASGLPVLVSEPCGCVPDLVNANTGWVFSPLEESALVRTLDLVDHLDAGCWQRMSIEAARVAMRYGPAEVAERVLRSLSGEVCGSTGVS